MKNKKIFAMLLIVIMATGLFGGCNETDLAKSMGSDDYEELEDNPDSLNDDERPCITFGGRAPIVVGEDGDLRNAIIDDINNRNAEENRSSKTSFYFPTVKIDGFKAQNAWVSDGACTISYVLEGVDPDCVKVRSSGESWISIWIYHFELFDEQARSPADIINDLVSQGNEGHWDYLFEDGVFYCKRLSFIFTTMGDNIVRIDAPPSLNSYDYLRSLARQVIDTAELVKVG